MITYKHSNGRIMARNFNGTFRNFKLSDFGLSSNTQYMVCNKCGYGDNEKWMPILRTGKCPQCNNQTGNREKEFEISNNMLKIETEIKELKQKIGGAFIDPVLYNEHKDDLITLENKLSIETQKCIDKAFKLSKEKSGKNEE